MSFRRRNIELSASSGSLKPATVATAAASTSLSSDAFTSSENAGVASPVKGITTHPVTTSGANANTPTAASKPTTLPGIRPSPVDGRPTTSTGTASLDAVLAGHGGLPLGNSLLVEESGTTDYAGILLRYYAAEGILQGHKIHVLGAGEFWTRELPGLSTGREGKRIGNIEKTERMKIAWRYERLGEFGSGLAGRGGPPTSHQGQLGSHTEKATFCHSFDLTKRLEFPVGTSINFVPILLQPNHISPFQTAIKSLSKSVSSSPPNQTHRIVIPSLLSPTIYPYHASNPSFIIQFLHFLRGLLRKHPARLTAMINLPIELYPRSSALVRWIELLSDGVLEVSPFLYQNDAAATAATSAAATAKEEPPQGLIKIHRLPVLQERGGGGGSGAGSGIGGGGRFSLGEDLAFVASRKTFTIKPFHLPPVDGEGGRGAGSGDGGDAAAAAAAHKNGKGGKKEDLEF